VKIALLRPQDLGLPFTVWEVAKLSDYCRSPDLPSEVSNEWSKRLLRRKELSFQHSKTWKGSPDPEFWKMNLILGLYHEAPRGGAVICYDEWGPLELRPVHGGRH
jgi:hypothetical protein